LVRFFSFREEPTENVANTIALKTINSQLVSNIPSFDTVNGNLEDFVLVWFVDTRLDPSHMAMKDITSHLRHVINYLKVFSGSKQCIEFIQTVQDQGIFLIISDSSMENIIPFIYESKCIEKIYVLSENYSKTKKLTDKYYLLNYSTIPQGNITTLVDVLSKDVHVCSSYLSSLNVLSENSINKSIRELKNEDAEFMNFQILLEILCRMKFANDTDAKYDIFSLCRQQYAGNDQELETINEFEATYKSENAIWWYTRECFLYRLLNKALRTQNIDVIFQFRYFLADLHQQLAVLHRSSAPPGIVKFYRGQGINMDEITHISKNIGRIIAMNSCLSTSTEINVAIDFAQKALSYSSDVNGVLFEINIDSRVPTKPFANIDNLSYFRGEREILFSMGAIFRIISVQSIGNRMWHVTLINDEQHILLKELYEYLKDEIDEETSYHALVNFAFSWMHDLELSKRWAKLLQKENDNVEEEKNHDKIEEVYRKLGVKYIRQTTADQALNICTQDLGNYLKMGTIDIKKLADAYDALAEAFWAKEYYDRSIEHRKIAIHLYEQIELGSLDIASAYQNIGMAYSLMTNKKAEALENFLRAAHILGKCLPPSNYLFCFTYNLIAETYTDLGDTQTALRYYIKSVEIQRTHYFQEDGARQYGKQFAGTLKTIGDTYEQIGDILMAIENFKIYIEIMKTCVPCEYRLIAIQYTNIAKLYVKQNKTRDAIENFEKAIQTQQSYLPPYHADIADAYKDLAREYERTGDKTEAIRIYEKILEIVTLSQPKLVERYRKKVDELVNTQSLPS
jgi:tetratricopeptide (TPR) repeat protein